MQQSVLRDQATEGEVGGGDSVQQDAGQSVVGVVSAGEAGCAGVRCRVASLQHQEDQDIQLQGIASEIRTFRVLELAETVQGRQKDEGSEIGLRSRHGVWIVQQHPVNPLGLQ